MDAHLLATLVAVRDAGGVTAAARTLHRTPSAVSQQLKTLQREAGTPLLERVGRGVRLTPAGLVLAERAVDVAVALRRAEAACDGYLRRATGTVRVAAFQSAARLLFPGLLARVGPVGGIDVRLADEDVAEMEFPALTAEHDVVVAHRPDRVGVRDRAGSSARDGVLVVPLLREPLDVALPLDHPLAGRDAVRPQDLVGEPWISVRAGFPVAAVLDDVARAAGAEPLVVQRINDFRVVEALVTAGHGIALLPRYCTDDRDGTRLRMVPLVGVEAGRRIEALLRPDRAERVVVQQVLAALRAEADRVTRTDPDPVEVTAPG